MTAFAETSAGAWTLGLTSLFKFGAEVHFNIQDEGGQDTANTALGLERQPPAPFCVLRLIYEHVSSVKHVHARASNCIHVHHSRNAYRYNDSGYNIITACPSYICPLYCIGSYWFVLCFLGKSRFERSVTLGDGDDVTTNQSQCCIQR